jgi:hypothetical protein
MLPRIVVVAVVVGAAAFVAGLQLGGGRPSGSPGPAAVASVSPSSSAQPSQAGSASTGPPYSSLFAERFQPPDLFAGFVSGAGCVTHNESSQEAIGSIDYVLTRSWTTFCPLKAPLRGTFVTDLIDAIGREVPGTGHRVSFSDVGSTLARFPYTDSGFVGTVTLTADGAGSGFEIAIILEERRSP